MAIINTLKDNTNKSKNPFASDSVVKILNYRIEQEESSSRLYHSMSMYLNNAGYLGAAEALQKDADDEMKHAQWAKEYLLDMGIQPTIPALGKPEQSFSGLSDIIKKSYDHEIMVTQQCNELAKEGMKTADYLLYQLANKFLQEQQEELGKAQNRIDRIKIIGDNPVGLLIIDKELGEGKI
jgi:ferritin